VINELLGSMAQHCDALPNEDNEQVDVLGSPT